MRRRVWGTVLGLSLMAGLAVAQESVKPGGWEFKTALSLKDASGNEIKPMGDSVMKYCLSASFASKQPYLTPGLEKDKMVATGADCTISDQRRQGNSASWLMRCKLPDGSLSESRVENQASAQGVSLWMETTVMRGKEKVSTTLRGTGRYLGACTSDMMPLN